MNFADAFQSFVSKITGQTDRLEAATVKLESALTSREEATAENLRLTNENATLKNSLKDALAETGTPEDAVNTAVTSERQRIESAVESDGLFKLAFDAEGKPAMSLAATDGFFALAPSADGKPALSLTDAGKTHFVNAEAARVLAASGHAPLNVAVDSPAPGNQGANGQSGKGRTKSTWGR